MYPSPSTHLPPELGEIVDDYGGCRYGEGPAEADVLEGHIGEKSEDKQILYSLQVIFLNQKGGRPYEKQGAKPHSRVDYKEPHESNVHRCPLSDPPEGFLRTRCLQRDEQNPIRMGVQQRGHTQEEAHKQQALQLFIFKYRCEVSVVS